MLCELQLSLVPIIRAAESHVVGLGWAFEGLGTGHGAEIIGPRQRPSCDSYITRDPSHLTI